MTPTGAPETVSVTRPEKPPVRMMVTSTDALSAWARAREGIAVDKTTDGPGDGAAVVSEHAETVAQARRSAARWVAGRATLRMLGDGMATSP